jgi:hypothetical protein
MATQIVYEIWSELSRFLNPLDKVDAAESLVSILIDHDISAEEIADTFKKDKAIKTALEPYLDEIHEEEEEYYEEEDEDY